MASGEKRDISCVSRGERVREVRVVTPRVVNHRGICRIGDRSPRLYFPGINIPRPARPDHPYPAAVPRLDFVNGADSSRRIEFPVVNTEDRAAALALRARGERDPDLEWVFALEEEQTGVADRLCELRAIVTALHRSAHRSLDRDTADVLECGEQLRAVEAIYRDALHRLEDCETTISDQATVIEDLIGRLAPA